MHFVKFFSLILLLIFGLNDLFSDEKINRLEKYWLNKSYSLMRYINKYGKFLFCLGIYSIFYALCALICLIIFITIYRYLIVIFTLHWIVWFPCLILVCTIIAYGFVNLMDYIDKHGKTYFQKEKQHPPWEIPAFSKENKYTYVIIVYLFSRVLSIYEEIKRKDARVPNDIQVFYRLVFLFGYIEYIFIAGLALSYGLMWLTDVFVNYIDDKFGKDEFSWIITCTSLLRVVILFIFVALGIVFGFASLPIVMVCFIGYFPILSALLIISFTIRLFGFIFTFILWSIIFYPALLLKKISNITGQSSIFKIGKYIVWAISTTILISVEFH